MSLLCPPNPVWSTHHPVWPTPPLVWATPDYVWATPHPYLSYATSCLSYTSPCLSYPTPVSELRRTLSELRPTKSELRLILSDLRRTCILSTRHPVWATPHPVWATLFTLLSQQQNRYFLYINFERTRNRPGLINVKFTETFRYGYKVISHYWTVLCKLIRHRRALFKKTNDEIKSFSAFPFGFKISRRSKELRLRELLLQDQKTFCRLFCCPTLTISD